MKQSLVQRTWDALSDRIGADLRGVIRYDVGEFETIMRQDVRKQHSITEVRPIVDYTFVNQRFLRDTSPSFDSGALHVAVRVFDDAWVVIWPDDLDRRSGIIVSLDRTGPPRTAVEDCIDYLDSHVDGMITNTA